MSFNYLISKYSESDFNRINYKYDFQIKKILLILSKKSSLLCILKYNLNSTEINFYFVD